MFAKPSFRCVALLIPLSLCLAGKPCAALAGNNVALGKPYTMSPAPNYRHCTDAGDATQLTDGKHAKNWTDKAMVGWQVRKGKATVIIDLGKVHAIDQIAIRAATGMYASVAFPKAALAFVSEDGKQFYYCSNVMVESPQEGLGAVGLYRFVSPPLKTKGRYVKLLIVAGSAFTFVDEIEVLEDDRSTAHITYDPTKAEKNFKLDDLLLKEKRLARQRIRLLRDLDVVVKKLEPLETGLKQKLAQRAEALREQIRSIRNVVKWNLPAGPPYTPLHREVFALHRDVGVAILPGRAFVVWPANPWVPIKPMVLPTGKESPPGWDLKLLGNEYEPIAFNVTNLGAKNLPVDVDAKSLPAAVVHEAVFVEATGQQMINDALPKAKQAAGGLPRVVVPPGITKQIWVVLNTANAKAGIHKGSVRLKVGTQLRNLAVRLQVLPLRIADKKHINTYSWAYLDWPILIGHEREAYADLRSHYQNTVVVKFTHLPKVKLDKNGKVLPLDFSQLDRQLDWQPDAQMYLLWLGFDHPNYLGFTNMLNHRNRARTWAPQFKSYIRQLVKHLKSKGIGYDRFALYLVDEPGDDLVGADAPFLDIVVGIKQMDPHILTYLDYCPSTDQTIPIVAAAYDILCPAMTRVESQGRAEIYRKTGKRIWSYQCSGPSNKMYCPLGYYRRQLWSAWNAGFTGAGFWAYADTGWGNEKTPNRSAWDDMDTAGGDYAVVYESPTGPVSSRRWEAWREGVEDYEYFWLLRDKLEKAVKSGRSGPAVVQARRVLAEAPTMLLKVSKQVHANRPSPSKVAAAVTKARREILDALIALGK